MRHCSNYKAKEDKSFKAEATYSRMYDEIISTMGVYSYFMKDKTLFFELLQELQEIECECGRDFGNKIVFHIIKMFGGLTIEIPSAEEFNIYKFLINNIDFVIEEVNKDDKYVKILQEIALAGIVTASPTKATDVIRKFHELIKGGELCQTIRMKPLALRKKSKKKLAKEI